MGVPHRYHSAMTSQDDLLAIGFFMADLGADREEIIETIEIAKSSTPQRLLNAEEYNIFAGSIARAVDMMPTFRDAISLIRPFRDYSAPTLYTDRYSRVGIGSAFFLEGMDAKRRASLLLHEAMHILNNHFTRMVDFAIEPGDDNDAKDLEINSLLDRHPQINLKNLLLPSREPYRFSELKSYEQYAKLMKDRGMLKTPQGEGKPEEKSAGDSGEPPEDSQGRDETEKQDSQPGDPQDKQDEQSGDPSDSESSEGEPTDGDSTSEDGSPSEDGDPSDKSDDGSPGESEGSGEPGEPSNSSGNSSGSSGAPDDAESIADDALESSAGGSDSDSEHSHNHGCDHADEDREEAADELGVDKASSAEQAVARNNTMARVREEAANSKLRGDKEALLMLQKMELAMAPSKVDWRVIFRNLISNCRDAISLGRSEHTYKRVNRRMSSGEFIFPGMIRYEPSAIMAIDTSGSMSMKDFAFLLSELEKIVKSVLRTKDRFRAFCVDAAATEPKPVKSIRDLDLFGGGGTKMEIAIRSVELLPKREIPDVFILATDGGTSWPAFKRELLKRKHKYRVVVLITQEKNFTVAKKMLQGLADVVDISATGSGNIGY